MWRGVQIASHSGKILLDKFEKYPDIEFSKLKSALSCPVPFVYQVIYFLRLLSQVVYCDRMIQG